MKRLPASPLTCKGASKAALLLLALHGLGCASAERARPVRAQRQALSAAQGDEVQGRARLERWCSSALTAQAGRCTALQRLLVQTEQSKVSPVSQLELDAATLADSAERQRIAARIARSTAKQRLMAAKLDAEDAAKDAAVLQRVSDQLDKANGYQALLYHLISGAKAEEGKRRGELLLVQTKEKEDPGQVEVARLQEKYHAKRKAISQGLQQRFTADRSMEVLTASLEDESIYLADLQTTCDLGKKVYQRLETGPMMVLNHSLTDFAQRLQNAKRDVVPGTRVADAVPSGAGVPQEDAQLKARQETGDTAPLTLAKALQALPKNTLVAAQPRSQLPSPKKTTSHTQSPSVVQSMKAPPKASNTSMPHGTAKTVSSRANSLSKSAGLEHNELVHSIEGPREDVEAPQQPKMAASHVRSGQTHSRHLRRQAATEAPRSAGPTKLQAASSSPSHLVDAIARPSSVLKATPAPSPSSSSSSQSQPAAGLPLKVSTPKAEASFGDESVEATVEVAKAKPQLGSHRAPQAAKKTKDSVFMDGVYGSATGNMPGEYHAWTPDGSTPTEHLAVHAPDASPTKQMLALLGDNDQNPDIPVSPRPAMRGKAANSHLRSQDLGKPKPSSLHAKSPKLAQQEADHSEAVVSAAVNVDHSDDDARMSSKATTPAQNNADADSDASLPEAVASPASKADHDGDDATVSLTAAVPSQEDAGAGTEARHVKSKDKDVVVPSEDSPATEMSANSFKPQGKAKVSDELPDTEAGSTITATDEDPATNGAKKVDDVVMQTSVAAEKPTKRLGFDSDEAVDQAFPAQEPAAAPAQRARRGGRRGSLVQKASAGKPKRHSFAGAVNLPTQYAAWNPDDDQASKKDMSLEQMVADFKNDDESDEEEDAAAAAAKKRAQHRRKVAAAAPRTTPAPQADEANVVYDDDDLPKHHKRPISLDLEGGWKSFITKGAAAAKGHKPKMDPDVAIMNNLYSNDGGLPKQYTAWQPSADDVHESAEAHAGDDVKAAARELDGAVALTQLSSVTLGLGPVARLIRRAAEGAAGDGEDEDARVPLVALLEESAVASNKSGASVASAMLEQYSEALNSQTLRQLAHAKLAQPKLAELWQRLQKVDPLTHPGAAAAPGERQAQAERWCQYFMHNEQSASPLHNAVAAVEKDSNTLAESTSQRAAMAEEADARQQLVRTVEQDVSSLTTLLNATQQEHTSAISLSKEDMTTLQRSDVNGTQDLMAFQGSMEAFQAVHAELADLLEATLKRRVAVLEAQRAKLTSLNKDAQAADQAVKEKQATLARSTNGVEATQRKLEGIQASCDATLSGLWRRQHSGHMEAHAIEVALKVLGSH